MVIKRDSLRAKRDFFSPMQGDRTEIRYSAAPERRDTLTSEVKRRLADIGSNTRRAAPVIEAIKTEMKKTADPFTKVEEQKSYAPQQDRGFADVLGQAAGAASAVGSAIGSGVEQVTQAVSAAGSKVAENRAEQAAQRAAEKAELDKRFSGIETGLSNLGSDYKQQELAAIDRYNQFRDQLSSQDQRFNAFSLSQLQRDIQQDIATRKTAQDAKTYEQNRLKEGEKFANRLSGLSNQFGSFSAEQLKRNIEQDIAIRKTAQDAKTYEQNRLKEGEKFSNRLSGIEQQQTNFSGRLQDNERGQYAFNDRLTGLSNRFGSFSAEQLKRNIEQDIAIRKTAQDAKAYEQNRLKEGEKFSDRLSGLSNQFGSFSAEQLKRDIQQDIETRKVAQDAKTYEQNRLKEGEKFANRLSGIEQQQTNFSGKLQDNERGQYAFADRLTGVEKAISERPKQTVAALPSDYKETEAKAFLDAKAYQALKDSGLDKTVSGEDAQVNVGSGSLGSFGLGTAGKGAPSGAALPAGSFGSGSRQTIESSPTSKVDTDISRHSPGTSADQPKKSTGKQVTYRDPVTGQKTSVRPPGQTVASLPSNYTATEREAFKKAAQFKAEQAAVDKKSQELAKATGIPSGADLKEGSFGISAAGKAQAEANRTEAVKKAEAVGAQETPAPKFDAKQYLANYKDLRDAFGSDEEKARQHYKEYGIKEGRTDDESGKIFDARSYLDNYADLREAFGDDEEKARQHYKEYGIKEGRTDISSAEGKRFAQARNLASKVKDAASKIKSAVTTQSSSNINRSQSRRGATTGSRSRGGVSRGASKSNTGSKSASRGAKGGTSSRSRGGTGSGRTSTSRTASKASRSRTGRSRTRCDIRTKVDISSLKNQNLVKDDLADVAYFVKELQESN